MKDLKWVCQKAEYSCVAVNFILGMRANFTPSFYAF